MVQKHTKENVTKYFDDENNLLGSVHQRTGGPDSRTWQFTNFEVAEGSPGHVFIYSTRDLAEGKADSVFAAKEEEGWTTALSIWAIERSPDYEERCTIIVAAPDEMSAQLYAVRGAGTSYAADYAAESAIVTRLGIALPDAVAGQVLFHI